MRQIINKYQVPYNEINTMGEFYQNINVIKLAIVTHRVKHLHVFSINTNGSV